MAVIGSGIVGASVGWHLACHGVEVVMIDADQPGAGVTNWSFSWCNASNKTETRAYFDLNVAGLSAYRALAADVGAGDWWHPTGHLRWFDDPLRSDALRRSVDHLRSWDYDADIWKAEKVRRLLEPDVGFPDEETDVAFYGAEGWIDGRSLVDTLLVDAFSRGAKAIFGRPVSDIVVKGDRVDEVVLSGRQHEKVDAVIDAAGPAGRDVARFVGRTLPLRDEPGLVVRLRCPVVPVRRAMHSPHVELRPDRPHQVVLHSREIDALIDPATDPAELVSRLRRLAVDVVPALDNADVIEAHVAWRPIPIDGFPSVGAIEGLDGYYEAVTHSGITLGLIIGRLLAQEVVDGTVDTLIAPYRPDRFREAATSGRSA